MNITLMLFALTTVHSACSTKTWSELTLFAVDWWLALISISQPTWNKPPYSSCDECGQREVFAHFGSAVSSLFVLCQVLRETVRTCSIMSAGGSRVRADCPTTARLMVQSSGPSVEVFLSMTLDPKSPLVCVLTFNLLLEESCCQMSVLVVRVCSCSTNLAHRAAQM